MKNQRPIAFILASTNHGLMIINRHDYHSTKDSTYGVGYQLLNSSTFDSDELDLSTHLLNGRKANYGDGVVAIDCGANIGVHTIQWARTMYGWGSVLSFEPQERLFYALAGNISVNNCFNATAIFAAVGDKPGKILVPNPNYFIPSSFGSLQLRYDAELEFIGQSIDYSKEKCSEVQLIALDQLQLERVDFIKLDIEGMEIEALNGARKSIKRFKPQLLIERIKSDENKLKKFLTNLDYNVFYLDINILAIHKSDPEIKNFKPL